MQPLEYKYIGNEEHLTFDSIRRMVLHQLSDQSEREAKKHIGQCVRCKGIHQSLVAPAEVRKQHLPNRKISPALVGILLVFILIGLATSVLYFGAELKAPEKVAQIFTPEINKPIESNDEEIVAYLEDTETVDPVIESNDTPAQIAQKTEVLAALPTNKQFDEYIEKKQTQPLEKLRGIYGKITADGKPLPGVTVMVPGSKSGRVSDEGGKYYIQIPRSAQALLFIYQGKQLLKPLDPSQRSLNINLNPESLAYPEPAKQETPANI
jgi:hypothetical protein